jgi:hypothetical protein
VLLPRILSEHDDRSGNQDQKEAADGETEDDSDHDNRDQHSKLPLLSCHAATVLPCASPVFPGDLVPQANSIPIASLFKPPTL